MATRTWSSSAASTSWTTGGNWVGGTAPASTDFAVIPGSSTTGNWPIITRNTTIAQVTINAGGQLTISRTSPGTSSHTLTISGAGASGYDLSNAGTITLTGTSGTAAISVSGTGGISNSGTIQSSGTATLTGGTGNITNSGTISVTGGTLTVNNNVTSTGIISTSGGNATFNNNLTVNTGGTVSISANRTLAVAGTLTNNSNTSGGITVNGTLTETGNTQIANAGTVTLSGGTLSDSGTGGLSNTGTINSSGTSALNVGATHAIGNTGAIHVTGGTLTVTGLITDTGSSTITIGSGATLTTSQLITNTSGTITLNNGTLTDSGGLTLTAGGLTGYGTVNAAITGGGTITANGGSLTLSGQVDASGAASSLIIDNGSTLQLTSSLALGTASINPTLTFIGNGDLFIDTAAAVGTLHLGAISGFSGTDKIQIKAIGSGDTVSWSPATNKLTISNGLTSQTFTFAAGTQGQYITVSDVSGVDTLTICFMPGTMIRTPDGEVAVEALKPGDLVLTTTGEAKPVNWVGRQTVSKRFADPLRSYPIRVRAGALDDNVPARDLLISPDHALLVGGVMVQAGALVNGTSITRERTIPDTFVYYHVELDDHSLILAEGAPAETFVDNVDRMNFDNWSEYQALYPNGKTVEELPYPRAKSHRQVPVPLRVALAERALGLGAGDAAEVA